VKDAHCLECPFKDFKYVGPEGDIRSQLIIIGEAPGRQEEEVGRPFVGGAGKMLDGLLLSAGIQRSQAYITNVLKCRPPYNEIKGNDSFIALRCCTPKLHEELQRTNARVIVPMGNTAIQALGINYTITQARGTVFPTSYGKIIPTWHPAYILRQYQEYVTSIYDWRKIVRHLKDPTIPQHTEHFILNPTIKMIEQFVADVLERVEKGLLTEIALDLETGIADNILKNPIKMIGFATSEEDAIVIPFRTQAGCWNWPTIAENIYVIELIARILENPKLTKIVQNSLFDIPILMEHGWEVKGPIYDTMLARYLIYNLSPLNLGYLVSLYCDFPAWKLTIGQTDMEYRAYNARDNIVLKMLKPFLDEDMHANGVTQSFNNWMKAIIPISKMMLNGIGTDRFSDSIIELKQKQFVLLESMRTACGNKKFNPTSPKQLKDVLFHTMMLKSSVHTDSGDLSTSKKVIDKLIARNPDNEFLKQLSSYQNISSVIKELETIIPIENRIYPGYRFNVNSTFPGFLNDESDIIRKSYCSKNILLCVKLKNAYAQTMAYMANTEADNLTPEQTISYIFDEPSEVIASKVNLRKQLTNKKRIRNLYGRVKFYTEYISDKVFNDAYNYVITSTIQDFIYEKLEILNSELDFNIDKLIFISKECLYFEVIPERLESVTKIIKKVMEYPSCTPSDIVLQHKVLFEKGFNLYNMEEFSL
jgi:uracil-DNA glycosylase